MTGGQSEPSRRDVLRTVTATAATPLGVLGGLTLGTETARGDHRDQQPADVTIEFDRGFLEQYRPRLDLSAVEANSEDNRPNALFGWKATSPEHETDVAVFFAEYDYQQGILPGGQDSHLGDHEPFYVFVDSDTGDVQQVIYSAYHWLKGQIPTPTLFEETHVEAAVVSPWHQYVVGPVPDGTLVAVEDLTTAFDDWLDDEDFHDALAPGAVTNPWAMRDRQHWWREGSDGISVNAQAVSAMHWVSNVIPSIDLGGALESDDLTV